jgi:flagellar hook-basal body protein
MMRSMYSGVSGLRNHQTRMDVIGNNIANVNTTGFKKSRVVFKDMLYQNVRGASSPDGSRGGTNPMGVGLGMTLASIDQIHTGAPTTSTAKLTDMAINGNGYFVVNDGSNRYYTRAGAFDFDLQGNLKTADGYRVQGWLANPQTWVLNSNGDPTSIDISRYKTLNALATTEMLFTGNLDSGSKFQAAQDELQILTFGDILYGGTAGGQFRLTFDGWTTDDISVGSTATDTASRIEAALTDLPNIGAGNVAVQWNPDRQRFEIQFKGVLGATNLAAITPEIGPSKIFNGGNINIDVTTDKAQLKFDTNPDEGSGFTLTFDDAGTEDETTGFILIGSSTNETAANIQTALEATDFGKKYGISSVSWNDTDKCYDIEFTVDPAKGLQGTAVTSLFNGGTAAITTQTEGQEPTAVIPGNEIQTLDLTTAGAGNFSLNYGGQTFTTNISYDSDAATIQAALEEIPALKGNVTVNEVTAPVAGTSGGSFAIQFNTALAGTNVDQLVFTSPDGCNGNVITTTQGQAAGYPEDAVSGSKDVYDSQGNKLTVYYRFFKYEVEPGSAPGVTPAVQPITRWACDLSTDPLFEKQEGYLANTDFSAMDMANGGTVTGNGDKIFRVYNLPFDEMGNVKDPDLAKFTYNVNRQVPPPGNGTANISCTIDFAGLTQRAGDSSAWASSQNGYAQGNLTSYSVGVDGTITGVYDNGQRRNLARVAVASFENPSGLEQIGGTMFTVSSNSGDAHIGSPGSQGLGKIIPSSLEMSNVDLSEEFTDMIVTQRGFQANSRIITTSDEMLQELVNLKR